MFPSGVWERVFVEMTEKMECFFATNFTNLHELALRVILALVAIQNKLTAN